MDKKRATGAGGIRSGVEPVPRRDIGTRAAGRLYRTSRVLVFLMAALLACQIPLSRSNAADTPGGGIGPH